MLIISWNVAGLSTTLQRIDTDYGSESIKEATCKNKMKSSLPRCHAFAHFLSRHGSPDIFCVQEHKIPLAQLSSRSEPLGASFVPGYESFWSCCVDSKRKGFNGVVTYAKIGTVCSANSSPLGSKELDEQGRCVMTDHGDFVVFNVYVPAGGSNPLSYKMKFLKSLRNAMEYQRKEMGKKVILVGDLNISHRGQDLHWSYRSLAVDGILEEVREHEIDGDKRHSLPKWKVELERNWPKIVEALETKEAVAVKTKNVTTGTSFDKFRVRVTVNGNRKVFLGGNESTVEEALCYFDFSKCTYFDNDLQRECESRAANNVSLDTLIELMSKVARIEWSPSTIQLIANTDALERRLSPTVKWLNDVIDADGMVDAFRYMYPNAKSRFTCWHQYTNRRFENEGTRIDYTLIDKSLLDCLERKPCESLRTCNFPSTEWFSEEAALHAATASGLFQGASFEGNGIATASQKALDTQFGPAHTGIIYTPPSYSDHVGVSLLLKKNFTPMHLVLREKNSTTRKSQPHKSQTSISSFFSRTPGNTNCSSSGSLGKRERDGISKPKQSGKTKIKKIHSNITVLNKNNTVNGDKEGSGEASKSKISSFFSSQRSRIINEPPSKKNLL